jgi:hypothetical protein
MGGDFSAEDAVGATEGASALGFELVIRLSPYKSL